MKGLFKSICTVALFTTGIFVGLIGKDAIIVNQCFFTGLILFFIPSDEEIENSGRQVNHDNT